MSIAKQISKIDAILTQNQKNRAHRYSLFPITDETSWKFFKTQEAAIWSSNEMKFVEDKLDFEKLSKPEKELLLTIFAFFSAADGLVSRNIVLRFLLECETYEEMMFFTAQLFIEAVHAETYALTIYTLIPDDNQRNELFEAVDKMPCVKEKADWMEKYMYSDLPKPERFVAFACAEGIFFITLFGNIFYFRKMKKLKNVVFSNEQVKKDESLHRDYGCYMYRKYSNGTAEERERVKEIVLSAVEVEKNFCKALLPNPIGDLDYERFCLFIESIADGLFISLGLSIHFGSKNPYTWLEDLNLEEKNNFYDVSVGAYKQSSLKEAVNWKSRVGGKEEIDPYSNPDSFNF
jgi:ribonucleoside-diphosphate reductase beta chain